MKPMSFKEAPVTDVNKYIGDPDYWFQQKVDGIRVQLRVTKSGVYFFGKNGEELKSTTALKTINAILPELLIRLTGDFMGIKDEIISPYAVDGEILDGVFWVFDFVVPTLGPVFYGDRNYCVEVWVDRMKNTQVRALGTAKSTTAKKALWNKVVDSGGEGVVAKRWDAAYDWSGKKTDTSVKLKITSTIDVVVMDKGLKGKNNALIGFYSLSDESLFAVGSVSLIGKEKEYEINVFDVVEIEYLHASPDNCTVTQPRILRKRDDKKAEECTSDQLRFVSKDVHSSL